MSARKRHRRVVASDSEDEPGNVADGGVSTVPARLGRLRRAGHGAAAAGEQVIDLCDEPAPGSAARAAAPPPGELVTPQPARQPEAPVTLRRTGLRDRVPSARKAPQRAALALLRRKRSGAAALEDSDEDDGSLSGSGGGSSGAEEEPEAGEGSADEEPSSSDDDGFIVSDNDEEGVDAAVQLLRGMIGGRAMDESLRLVLYAQLRLLRLLGALPHAGSLSDEVKAVIAAALSIERNLLQFAVQSQNLEHWRHADPGLKARFEEYEALETEEGGYRWGKHCSFCRHDRHRQIAMLTLCFLGRRQPVAFLEPVLAKRGLLPGSGLAAADELSTPSQPVGGNDGSDSEDGSGASSASGSSSSSEDDEPLSAGYARRQALRMQQERQAQRAQRAQQRQQRAGTPLRARQVARELATAGDGGSADEDSLLGGAAPALHAARRRRQVGRKRQRAAIESSDDDEEQQRQAEEQPASSQEEGSQQEEEEEEEEGSAGRGAEEREEWAHGTDPEAGDSSASELGKQPRRRPRIGTDCWARALVYRSIHRYPARLDAMLLYCTRRYLAATPEAEQPCSLAGLAHAVLQRYGHPLVKHYNEFMYSINSFNLLQNRKSDKSFANSCIVNELKGLQYARFTELSPDEELWGVSIAAELAAFTAGAAERRQAQLDASAAVAGGDAAAAAEEVDEVEEDCGRLLLLRAAGGGGSDAADSEEEGQGGDVQYAAEEQPDEPEEPGQRRRPRQRRTQQQLQERLEASLFQRQRRRGTAQQGGQRAAAAIAAAAADYGGQGGNDGLLQEQGSIGRCAAQPGSEQRQGQHGEEDEAPRDRNACFYCGGAGHWAAACPERQRCFHCKQIGHWSRDCPQLQRGSCYKCRQPGHWAANCPNG